ncbi:hypothetical protein D3C71_1983860 [compost metagenome]
MHGSGVGAVGAQGQGLAAIADDLLGQGLGRACGADIRECDLCAFPGQTADDGGTDAARTALDQGDFAFE